MPLYEYNCPNCGKFEHLHRKMGEKLEVCPTCSGSITYLMSSSNLRFNGSGFFSTDYCKSKKSEEPNK